MKKDNIHIRVSRDLKEEFFRRCEEKGLTPSDLLRNWIIQFNQREEKEVALYPTAGAAGKDAVERDEAGLTGSGQTCGPEFFEGHGWAYKTWDDRYLIPGGELPEGWLEKYF